MSFVAIKSEEQLDLQALHRARESLLTKRTCMINKGSGFMMERDIRFGMGRQVLQRELMRLMEDGTSHLSRPILLILSDETSELATINGRVHVIHAEIKTLARADTDM